MFEQRVMARVGLLPVDGRILLAEVAEGNGAGRARTLAGSRDLVRSDKPVVALGCAARSTDALDAVGALFHDAARPHRDLGIFLGAVGFKSEVGVFLAVGITEEFK